MSNCQDHCCQASSASQSLDEMEFERGIWYAAQYGDLERVKMLVNRGTPVDLCDNAGYTALHYASRSGYVDVCKYLLTNHANINAVTKSGKATALHRAANAGKMEIVSLLLTNKADYKMKDSDGKTVLHRAAENKNISICQLLLKICPDLINETDNRGKTALSNLTTTEMESVLN